MARKSSLKQPPKAQPSQSIGRRVSVVMTSDGESDESLVIVPRSSVSYNNSSQIKPRNSVGRNSIKSQKHPPSIKPQPRTSINKPNHQSIELSSDESDQEIYSHFKSPTQKSTNNKESRTNPKSTKNSKHHSNQATKQNSKIPISQASHKQNQYKPNKHFDSDIYNSNYKEPEKITKNKKSKSSHHPNGNSSEPQRVESYEEFYRRKSVNLTDVEDLVGLQCPDCGQIFKTTLDSKRHFNLIHRTSKKQIAAKKRIQALKKNSGRPSRWGTGNVNIGGLKH